jgi:hypothetical protein
MVAGPAIALLVIGILGIVLGVLFMGLFAVLAVFAMQQPAARGMDSSSLAVNMATNIASCLGSIVVGAILTYGGLQMKNLRSRAWARTASVIAMVPCLTCCLYGLPIGIWATVVLNKPEVSDAFSG